MKNKIVEKILAERYEIYLTEFRGVVPRIAVPRVNPNIKPGLRDYLPSVRPGRKPIEIEPHFPGRPPNWKPGQKPKTPTETPPETPTRPPTETPTETPARPPTETPKKPPTEIPKKPPTETPKKPPTETKPGIKPKTPTEVNPKIVPSSVPITVPVINPALNPLIDPITSTPIASPVVEPIGGAVTSIPGLLTVPSAAVATVAATATQLKRSSKSPKRTTTKTGTPKKSAKSRYIPWNFGSQSQTGAQELGDSGNLISRDIDLAAQMLGKYSRYLHI